MQTRLAEFVQSRPEHDELAEILRSCVHCGFCTATCPTYQITGNELDSPRGRIYLLKQMLEGQPVTALSMKYLDRCLSCRSCESTCPSGVRYSRLLDIGRELLERKVSRSHWDKIQRRLICVIFPYRRRFNLFLRLAQITRPLLPPTLRRRVPERTPNNSWPPLRYARKMLILQGCVQTPLAPQIDAAAADVLDRLEISLLRVETSGCCGAINYHMADRSAAIQFARKNIDACWPYIEQGAEAIVMTASGCGLMLKEYAELLQDDAAYADKALKVSAMTKDIAEILQTEDILKLKKHNRQKVVFQSPCTLQHGQHLSGVVENLLQRLGFQLAVVQNAHLCCGSAGTYSLLQPELSNRLLVEKLKSLTSQQDHIIASANIGCLMHLQSASSSKVVHWIELL